MRAYHCCYNTDYISTVGMRPLQEIVANIAGRSHHVIAQSQRIVRSNNRASLERNRRSSSSELLFDEYAGVLLFAITREGPCQHGFMCGCKRWSNDINESN